MTLLIFKGPGQYSPEKVRLSKSPQYTIRSRTEVRLRDNVPGPYLNIFI